MEEFSLIFERSGGVTGIPIKFELNSIDLSPDEKKQFLQLIKEIQNTPAYKNPQDEELRPDQFEYQLTLQKGNEKSIYKWNDQHSSIHFKELTNLLRQLQRRKK